jgi:hypothetical protein
MPAFFESRLCGNCMASSKKYRDCQAAKVKDREEEPSSIQSVQASIEMLSVDEDDTRRKRKRSTDAEIESVNIPPKKTKIPTPPPSLLEEDAKAYIGINSLLGQLHHVRMERNGSRLFPNLAGQTPDTAESFKNHM